MKKTLSFILSLGVVSIIALSTISSITAYAQTTATVNAPTNLNITLQNPLKTSTLDGFMVKVLDGVVLLLTPVVTIMMLYSGFLFVVARGNSEKLGDAKKALMYTLIGAAIILGAKGFATVIGNTISQF